MDPGQHGLKRLSRYLRLHREAHLRQLEQFLRFPSVSVDPRRAAEVQRCSQWLADHLQTVVGLARVDVVPTPRHPAVVACTRHQPRRPTILVYGHYDVQPAGPASAWRSPPFEPTRRGEDLYARGASDDKSQLFAHVKAIEAWLRAGGGSPVNLICLFEGEEEIGSPNLDTVLEHCDRFGRPDVAVMSDTRMLGPGRPVLTYGLRGSANLEIAVRGPHHELHSGSFGGIVANPVEIAARLAASLHDRSGHVAVRGFYDKIRPADAVERRRLERDGPTPAELRRQAGVRTLTGDREWTPFERTVLRPTLSVVGIAGGYQGPGVKAAIPPEAVVKINARLVPDQDPAAIADAIIRHVQRQVAPEVASVRILSLASPALLNPSHPVMHAASAAYEVGFGRRPVLLRSGGTIPVVDRLCRRYRIPTALMGFALPDDRMHAPNEKFHLPNLWRGVATCTYFYAAVATHCRRWDDPNESGRTPLAGGRVPAAR